MVMEKGTNEQSTVQILSNLVHWFRSYGGETKPHQFLLNFFE